MEISRCSLWAGLLAVTLATGCGVRDTEVDGVPGPGARSTVPEVNAIKSNSDPAQSTAGINSAGRPADSSGGRVGPTVIGDPKSSSTDQPKVPPPAKPAQDSK